ncbi:MAG: LysM peptidoglycan-binding domain-containing protein [Acidobacteria bacterium]|nr:LysM peptidoglycan-binding domain-containing protein [Acidobacteriota bacterium]
MSDGDGGLTRLKIDAHQKDDCSDAPVDSFTVLFNPNTYSQKYEVVYHARQGAGDTGSPQVYGKIKPQEYTFELLFDGTGTAIERKEVQDEIDRFLTIAGRHDSKIHRPRYLRISWGPLVSRCVLKSADITYTLFKPDGHPLRARVRAVFSENVKDTLRVAQERKSSPDLTHVHTVKAGEHLSLLADKYYGDASRYVQIAAFNRITNFRRLEPGRQLVFPPIRDAAP